MSRWSKAIKRGIFTSSHEQFNSVFFSFVVLKICIDFSYIFIGMPIHNYHPNVNLYILLLSYLLLAPISFVFNFDTKKPSTYGVVFLVCGILIPQLSYSSLLNVHYIYTITLYICILIIILLTNTETKRISFSIPHAGKMINILFYLYVVFTIRLIVLRGGIDLRSIDIVRLYDLRAENNVGGLWGYFGSISSRALFPFYFIYHMRKKNWLRFSITVFIQLAVFLSFGNKSDLLLFGILFIALILVKYNKYLMYYPLIFGSGLLASIILLKLNITTLPAALLIDRMSFIPVKIANNFYDFFTNNPKLWFGESMIGRITGYQSPYPEPLFIYISKLYTRIPGYSNENTGAFSLAFADGGLLMMIICAIAIAFIMKYFDSYNNLDKGLYARVYIIAIALLLVDSPLLTAFITGGIAVSMIMLLLLSGTDMNQVDRTDQSDRKEKMLSIPPYSN